jgi:signal transduction histidine kinase
MGCGPMAIVWSISYWAFDIAHTIVEAHGGRPWSEPNPGGGTIFRLTLKALSKRELTDGV